MFTLVLLSITLRIQRTRSSHIGSERIDALAHAPYAILNWSPSPTSPHGVSPSLAPRQAPAGTVLPHYTGGWEARLSWRTLRPLRILIFPLIGLPEQRLELLGKPVNVALPSLTALPP